MKKLIVLLASLCSFSVFAASEPKDMGFFEVLGAPQIGFGAGSYDIGSDDLDEGSFTSFLYGGYAGVKVGPLIIAADYLEGLPSAESDKTVSDADRVRFPLPGGKQQSVGFLLGLKLGNLMLLSSLYSEEIKQDVTIAGTEFEHAYEGSGYRFTVGYLFNKRIQVGAFYHYRKFDKYTSNHPTDTADSAELGRDFTTQEYGLSVAVVLPVKDAFNFFKKK